MRKNDYKIKMYTDLTDISFLNLKAMFHLHVFQATHSRFLHKVFKFIYFFFKLWRFSLARSPVQRKIAITAYFFHIALEINTSV